MDKAGAPYWNSVWGDRALTSAVDPRQRTLRNHVNQRFHDYFCSLFAPLDPKTLSLIEVGCGNSAWLPYFGKEFGFRVAGLDYSEKGCEQERCVLKAEGVTGQIICADMFSPPSEIIGTFDVAVSFGVVEHFDDTASAVRAIVKLLRPNGMIITIIPNMVGVVGIAQRLLNKRVFDIHQRIDVKRLSAAHEQAGCKVLDCRYFVSTSFGVANLNGVNTRTLTGFGKRLVLSVLSRISMMVWAIEQKVPIPSSTAFSPYVVCVGRRV